MSKAKKNECKACYITASVSDIQVKALLERLINSNKIKFVDEQTYHTRLSVCLACDNLEINNTCRQCGCIIQIRAAGVNSKCPYPKHPKWT